MPFPTGKASSQREMCEWTPWHNPCQLRIGIFHGHLPSNSTKIKSGAAAAADFQHPLKGVQGGEQK